MADYMFRYSMRNAPASTNDGSGLVVHRIWAVYLPEDSPTNEEWKAAPMVPGRSQDVNIPFDEMKAVMDMPHSNASQRQAKVAAYKDALASNLDTGRVPLVGWDLTTLEQMLDNNDASALEASRADEFISVTLNQNYPVVFSM